MSEERSPEEKAHDAAVRVALSMYLGEHCKYCDHKFTRLEELSDVVYTGYHDKGRIAHQSCWDANNPQAEAAK